MFHNNLSIALVATLALITSSTIAQARPASDGGTSVGGDDYEGPPSISAKGGTKVVPEEEEEDVIVVGNDPEDHVVGTPGSYVHRVNWDWCQFDVKWTVEEGYCDQPTIDGVFPGGTTAITPNGFTVGVVAETSLALENTGGAYLSGNTYRQPASVYQCTQPAKTTVEIIPVLGQVEWTLGGIWGGQIDYYGNQSKFVSPDSYVSTEYSGSVTLNGATLHDVENDQRVDATLDAYGTPHQDNARFTGSYYSDSPTGSHSQTWNIGPYRVQATASGQEASTWNVTVDVSSNVMGYRLPESADPKAEAGGEVNEEGQGEMTLILDRTISMDASIAPPAIIAEAFNKVPQVLLKALGKWGVPGNITAGMTSSALSTIMSINGKPKTNVSMGGDSFDELLLEARCVTAPPGVASQSYPIR